MCQITYANLHDKKLNALMVYLLTSTGADKHDDGVGFMCSANQIWKTEKAANKISNLGYILHLNIPDDRPVPAHIRMATSGIPILEKNAHPFIDKNYVLLHNGTLVQLKDTRGKEESDSELFLKTLEEARIAAGKEGNFVDIFNTAMSQFTGKFAFVIKDRAQNKDYIIRGKLAELWFTPVLKVIKGKKEKEVPIGYFVNTSKDTSTKAIEVFQNVAPIFTEHKFSFGETTLLKEETIFVAQDFELEVVGKTKEVPTPVKPTQYNKANQASQANQNPIRLPAASSRVNSASDKLILEHGVKIHDFLDSHSLNLLDFQILFYMASKASILEMSEEDILFFIRYAIPRLSAPKKVREDIKRKLGGRSFPAHLYDMLGLEYPWMVNKDRYEVILEKIPAKG